VPLQPGIRLFTFTSTWTLRAMEDWLEVRGVRLHYRAWGDRKDPIVVLLHGVRGSADLWWSVAGALGGWRVIALDQRGRGRSDWAPDGVYSHEACLLDFQEFEFVEYSAWSGSRCSAIPPAAPWRWHAR
jgi:pimeloyl-ACP methyl ester carboxylesterase